MSGRSRKHLRLRVHAARPEPRARGGRHHSSRQWRDDTLPFRSSLLVPDPEVRERKISPVATVRSTASAVGCANMSRNGVGVCVTTVTTPPLRKVATGSASIMTGQEALVSTASAPLVRSHSAERVARRPIGERRRLPPAVVESGRIPRRNRAIDNIGRRWRTSGTVAVAHILTIAPPHKHAPGGALVRTVRDVSCEHRGTIARRRADTAARVLPPCFPERQRPFNPRGKYSAPPGHPSLHEATSVPHAARHARSLLHQ